MLVRMPREPRNDKRPTAAELIAKARTINARRDATDRSSGFQAPNDSASDVTLRTAIDALHAGIAVQNWQVVAESYVLLCDLHRQMFGRLYDPAGDR